MRRACIISTLQRTARPRFVWMCRPHRLTSAQAARSTTHATEDGCSAWHALVAPHGSRDASSPVVRPCAPRPPTHWSDDNPGTGTFGRVRLVRHIADDAHFAMKMLKKRIIVRTKQLEHIQSEVMLLSMIIHPFIVSMDGNFQVTAQRNHRRPRRHPARGRRRSAAPPSHTRARRARRDDSHRRTIGRRRSAARSRVVAASRPRLERAAPTPRCRAPSSSHAGGVDRDRDGAVPPRAPREPAP